ncbi:MAG: hypothetical protein ACFB10_06070 [Salibacteraceae bacterium]
MRTVFLGFCLTVCCLIVKCQNPDVVVLEDTSSTDTTIYFTPYGFGGTTTSVGPWGEIAGSKQVELRAGVGVFHSITGCTGWITSGAGIGASYLPGSNWWGLSATGFYNPIFLNLAADVGAYRSWRNPVWYFRPRMGIRTFYFTIDYGYTFIESAVRSQIGRHSIRLQINYLKW